MPPRTRGVLFSGLWLFSAILAPASRAAVTPVSDVRSLQAEVFVLNGSLDQDTAFPVAPMAPFNHGVSTSFLRLVRRKRGVCVVERQRGSRAGLVHRPAADVRHCQRHCLGAGRLPDGHILRIRPLPFRDRVSLPTSPTGSSSVPSAATSRILSSSWATHPGPRRYCSTTIPATGPLGYDQVLPPGSYVFRVEAFCRRRREPLGHLRPAQLFGRRRRRRGREGSRG